MTLFSEPYTIRLADCDEQERLRLPVLVNLLMAVSNDQMTHLGLDTNQLLKQNLGWVIIQYHFEIKQLPKAGDAVVIWSRATGYNRFFEYRDLGMKTPSGEKLLVVHSQWVLLDLAKRKIQPATDEIMAPFKAPKLRHMPKFARMLALPQYDQMRRYRVRYYDLDTNRHLTNSHYFDWLIDMMPRDFLNDYVPAIIDFKFDKEVRYGDEPEVWVKDVSKTQRLESDFMVRNHDELSALAKISWQKDQS